MRRETRAKLRWKHAIGDHPLTRHRPVRRRFRAWNVRVRIVLRITVKVLVLEAVHLAVVPAANGIPPIVLDVPRIFEPRRVQRDAILPRVTKSRRVGSGKTTKQIIEAAVLLDDDNDVFDVTAQRRADVRCCRRRRMAARGQCNDQSTKNERGPAVAGPLRFSTLLPDCHCSRETVSLRLHVRTTVCLPHMSTLRLLPRVRSLALPRSLPPPPALLHRRRSRRIRPRLRVREPGAPEAERSRRAACCRRSLPLPLPLPRARLPIQPPRALRQRLRGSLRPFAKLPVVRRPSVARTRGARSRPCRLPAF